MRRFFQNGYSHFCCHENTEIVAFPVKKVKICYENLKSSDFYNKMNERVKACKN